MVLSGQHIEKLKKTCERHHVKSLYAFGSLVSGKVSKESDVDFLVEFGAADLENYYDNYLNFKQEVKEIVGRKVDLVEKQTLKNPVLINAINRDKVLIYEREDTQVVV